MPSDLLDQLQPWLVHWQWELRLQDWRVIASWVHPNELAGDNPHGRIEWNIQSKEAEIRICSPGSRAPEFGRSYDPEATLVHELLHLHFAPFNAEDGTPADNAQEQAINCIADALVKARRAGAKLPEVKNSYAPTPGYENTFLNARPDSEGGA